MNEDYIPVKIKKIVQGYFCSPQTSDFQFDLSLNYKLASVIETHSNKKPTLIVLNQIHYNMNHNITNIFFLNNNSFVLHENQPSKQLTL